VTRILVVDDELKIARLVRDYLVEAGFDVSTETSGTGAVAAARAHKPDLVVLDLGLPGMNGYDVTRSIRAWSAIPIVILTARSDETDRIIGLELGADDYIVKPFSPRELVARVRAVLRRTAGDSVPEVIRAAGIEISPSSRSVRRGDQPIELTATEFELLAALARQPGRVHTRGQLLDVLHGVSFDSYERAIDSHIKNLRKKIEPDPRSPVYIKTVYGVGYKFADEN